MLEVRLIRARDRDSVKNGMLIGLGVGAAMGTAWCIGAIADDSPDLNAGVECAEGFLVHPALGALIGLGVDAMIPGKKRLIYEAAPSRNESRGTLLLLPYVSRRAAGVTLAVGF